MLNKINRLSKERDFSKVFKKARSFYGANLLLKVISNGGRPSRFGFVVSNKVNKRATRRNAIKRRLRAIVMQNLDKWGQGIDAVVMVKKDYSFPYKTDEIKKELLELMAKSK